MRTCIECGAPLSDEDQFCLNCGADVPQPETDNTPSHEENTEPVEQQPAQQLPVQQEPIQQPVQQQQVQQPQAVPQQPVQQQPVMHPQAAPQQPMQQPEMYQQPGMYQQPEQKQGSSNKTLLYVLIPLLVIGAAVAILFATGVFSGKKDTAKTDQQEVTAQVQPSEQDQEQEQEQPGEEKNRPTALSAQNVTLGGITFPLAEGYEVQGRNTLKDGEACLIVPKGASDRSNRLILRVYPHELDGVNGITSEEIGDLLYRIVDANAGVFANKEKSGFKLDREYKVHYDDNADGSYFPHSYTYLNWTDRNGKYSRSYTEATLVKRTVVSGSAIATDEGELRALTDIYSEVVQAANK